MRLTPFATSLAAQAPVAIDRPVVVHCTDADVEDDAEPEERAGREENSEDEVGAGEQSDALPGGSEVHRQIDYPGPERWAISARAATIAPRSRA